MNSPIKISPVDLLIEIQSSKERDAAYTHKLDLFLECAAVALKAVYLSGHYGNTRCEEAVREIEKKLKQ